MSPDKLILTQHKHLFANSHSVLIDDSEENCRKFAEAGGHVILFPTNGNALYTYASNPLSVVIPQLQSLQENINAL